MGLFDDFESKTPTIPDGLAIPFDGEVEILEAGSNTPLPILDDAHRCPECEKGVFDSDTGKYRGLIRFANFVPAPENKEEASKYLDCVATQDPPDKGGWRWCAVTFFFKGVTRLYWGQERRKARLPPPEGTERRTLKLSVSE